MIVLVPSQKSLFQISVIKRKAYRLFVIILFILLTGAALFHVVEYMDKDKKSISFFDAFWFITLSTTSGLPTGVTTSNPFSRIVILYVMALGLILIPVTLSEILTLIRLRSKYIHSYKPKSKDRHVLVVGRFDHNSLQDFFVEFFSLDHGYSSINTKIIILNPEEPDDKLAALLGDPLYLERVQYVKGTSISFRQLQKCKANTAEACFVLSPKFATKNYGEDDAEAVMRALAS